MNHFDDSLVELGQFIARVGVVQTEHGDKVADWSKTFERLAADLPGRGVGRHQARVLI